MSNREILFRGKRVDNGEWAYGEFLHSRSFPLNDIIAQCIAEFGEFGETPEVVPETVGQYTGLEDKNGTKIFEGDVIKHNIYNEPEIDAVMWDGRDLELSPPLNFHWQSVTEVIGNIHDNPELLED